MIDFMKKTKKILLLLFVWLLFTGLYQAFKDLPAGVSYRGEERSVPASDIEFLADLTYENLNGEIVHEQEIFDSVFSLIDSAEEYILIDIFLFNSYLNGSTQSYRNLSSDLADKMIERKRAVPEIKIDFITDPINTIYGGAWNEEIESLKSAGVNVITTDLKPLRDSNPVYSSFWRTFFRWFGNSNGGGIVPHPLSASEPKVSLRSYLDLFNFKANHRKVFAADNNGKMAVIVTSANPHDGSSAHSNVALKISGGIGQDIRITESAVADFSGGSLSETGLGLNINSEEENSGQAKVQLLTEHAIKSELLAVLNSAGPEDKIMVGAFYLADREIIKALLRASDRDAEIRIILDPNKDAFGYTKTGVPNRPVAAELIKKSDNRIEVRWYDTHGEQFHTKLALIEKADGLSVMILGSANLTRRNLNNYNLETNIKVTAESKADFMQKAGNYFEKIWDNSDGKYYTVGYEAYKDEGIMKKIMYLIQEYIGIGSF